MTLTIQDLGALGELIGSTAVLATLVYLALQTRQNSMAIAAQLDAASIAAIQNIRSVAATSNELQEALNQDRVNALPIEEDRRGRYWGALIGTADWLFAQSHRGLLPSFSESGTGRSIHSLFSAYRSFGAFWEVVKPNYGPEFVEWVEEQRAKATPAEG
jgi:hypothetical protein